MSKRFPAQVQELGYRLVLPINARVWQAEREDTKDSVFIKGSDAKGTGRNTMDKLRAEAELHLELRSLQVPGVIPIQALVNNAAGCYFSTPAGTSTHVLSAAEFIVMSRSKLSTLSGLHDAGFVHGDTAHNWVRRNNQYELIDFQYTRKVGGRHTMAHDFIGFTLGLGKHLCPMYDERGGTFAPAARSGIKRVLGGTVDRKSLAQLFDSLEAHT